MLVFLASMVVGLFEGRLSLYALLPIGALLACGGIWEQAESRLLKRGALWLGLVVTLLLFLHKLPGFFNYKLMDGAVLSPQAKPSTFYANFDKPYAGLILLAFFCVRPKLHLLKALGVGLVGGLAASVVVMFAAMALGFVALDVGKNGAPIIEFLICNLLFVSLAEEALFRGVVQQRLANVFSGKPYLLFVAPLASSLLFALAHAQGGVNLMIFAGFAGICYAFIYQKTESVEAATVAHWLVNATHFLLFTYPSLK